MGKHCTAFIQLRCATVGQEIVQSSDCLPDEENCMRAVVNSQTSFRLSLPHLLSSPSSIITQSQICKKCPVLAIQIGPHILNHSLQSEQYYYLFLSGDKTEKLVTYFIASKLAVSISSGSGFSRQFTVVTIKDIFQRSTNTNITYEFDPSTGVKLCKSAMKLLASGRCWNAYEYIQAIAICIFLHTKIKGDKVICSDESLLSVVLICLELIAFKHL